MKYDKSLFTSTAEYYAKYRPIYPPELFDKVIEIFGLDKNDTVLDLGCGTGEISLPLSKYAKKVIAWDPDAGMLKIARQKAKERGITNIVFDLKSSDDLSDINDKVKFVIMGQSFHWMDGTKTLSDIKNILTDDGGVTIIGTRHGLHIYSSTFTEPNVMTAKRNEIVSQVATKYLGKERRAGKSKFKQMEQSFEDMEREVGFVDVNQTLFDITLSRSIDETIGFLYSTSWGNKAQLGDKAGDFEQELKEKLFNLKPDGIFNERIVLSLLTAKNSI
ncbi:methyltransferase [Alphaproteobacteria bacterium]|nr:methyltransferase [Alphaproteobacteria bacterium]